MITTPAQKVTASATVKDALEGTQKHAVVLFWRVLEWTKHGDCGLESRSGHACVSAFFVFLFSYVDKALGRADSPS